MTSLSDLTKEERGILGVLAVAKEEGATIGFAQKAIRRLKEMGLVEAKKGTFGQKWTFITPAGVEAVKVLKAAGFLEV